MSATAKSGIRTIKRMTEMMFGTVTMRLEDKSPKEAIEIIVESKGLTGGLHFDARSTRLLGERYAEAMIAARKEP